MNDIVLYLSVFNWGWDLESGYAGEVLRKVSRFTNENSGILRDPPGCRTPQPEGRNSVAPPKAKTVTQGNRPIIPVLTEDFPIILVWLVITG